MNFSFLGIYSGFPLLSCLVLFPLLFAIVIFLLNDNCTFKNPFLVTDEASNQGSHITKYQDVKITRNLYYLSVCFNIFLFVLTLIVYTGFNSSDPGIQYAETAVWIKEFGIHYALGVDGISIILILLSSLLFLAVIGQADYTMINFRRYAICLFILQSSVNGVLLSLDTMLFFVFWELMLIPVFMLIALWGGREKKRAANTFILYTAAGSILLFVSIIYVSWKNLQQTGDPSPTFLLEDLLSTKFTTTEQLLLSFGFMIAFAVKIPLFPLHSWMPLTYNEAPVGATVLLSGILLKLGLYGILRFVYPLFPDAAAYFSPYLACIGSIGILYGALLALVQTEVKKLIAYSSMSHIGFCVLGIAACTTLSLNGAMFHMFSHGVYTSALFILAGILQYKLGASKIADLSGVTSRYPLFAAFFLFFLASSVALPLTSGFIGEFTILTGSFKKFPFYTVLAMGGVIFSAVYMFTYYIKCFFGEESEQLKKLRVSDTTHAPIVVLLGRKSILTLVAFSFIIASLGVFPNAIFSKTVAAMNYYIEKGK
jgi:NADH-quinone oxidoreductase subunit M